VAQDTDQIRVAANGHVYVAAVGTAAPTDVATAWASGWYDLGYVDDDGVTLTDGREMEEIPVWQLMYPARRIVTGRNYTAAFNLRQWNGGTVKFAYGGGIVAETSPGSGVYRFDPPAPEVIDERALGIEWADGSLIYRAIMPRGMVTEDVETKLVRSAAADLPISFSVLGEDGVQPWYLLTNDPALAA
jgi:hypothetical protein